MQFQSDNPEGSPFERFHYYDLEYDKKRRKRQSLPAKPIAIQHFKKNRPIKQFNAVPITINPTKIQPLAEQPVLQTPGFDSNRKTTVQQLNRLEQDLTQLIHSRTDFGEINRKERVSSIYKRGDYRKFQRCTFFDREAIYRPRTNKKQSDSFKWITIQKLEEEQGGYYMEESTLDHREQQSPPKEGVEAYLPIVIAKPNKTSSKFDLVLKERIRQRILQDLKHHNTPNIKKDIRLSTLDNCSLWIEEFNDLKDRLVRLEHGKEKRYRKSIASREYDPYRQFLALSSGEKKSVQQAYNSTRMHSQPF